MKSYRHLNRTAGIYRILNVSNGHFYIGSSINIGHRFRQHISALTSYKHHNSHLQSAWNKYGRESFSFELVEVVENLERLLDIEQEYIDSLLPEYNISNVTRGGEFNPAKRKKSKFKHTPESKSKISSRVKAFWKEEREYMMAAVTDPARIEKIRNAARDMWANPEKRENVMRKLNSKSVKDSMSKTKIEWWQKNGKEFLEKSNNPRTRKLKSDSAKAMWSRDEYRLHREESLISNYKEDSRKKIKNVETIKEIRRLYEVEGMSQGSLAKLYDMTRSGIQSIVLRKTWKWVK